jgi:hypothetical protein
MAILRQRHTWDKARLGSNEPVGWQNAPSPNYGYSIGSDRYTTGSRPLEDKDSTTPRQADSKPPT